jgi:octaprenyl-diphosphate synthase
MSALSGAYVIELIHTATLVHDDVVDDGNRRRGFLVECALKIKLQSLWVIIYYQRDLSIDNSDFDLLRIISVAVREMSEITSN